MDEIFHCWTLVSAYVTSTSPGPVVHMSFMSAQKGEGQAREQGHQSTHPTLRVEYRGLGEML